MIRNYTDRELLELAAKAAGVPAHELYDTIGDNGGIEKPGWNPLDDDGDEARLEASLGFTVFWYEASVLVGPPVCGPGTGSAYVEYFDKYDNDKQAARRAAGVKAAAEIGRAME